MVMSLTATFIAFKIYRATFAYAEASEKTIFIRNIFKIGIFVQAFFNWFLITL